MGTNEGYQLCTVFSCCSTDSDNLHHILHIGLGEAPLKINAFSRGSGSGWFLGPTRVLTPNAISIGSAVLAQLLWLCPTDADTVKCPRLTRHHYMPGVR